MQSQREPVVKQLVEKLTEIEALGFRPSIVFEYREWQEAEAAWIANPFNPEDVLLPITRLTRRYEDINRQSERMIDERLAVKDVRSKWGHLIDHLPEGLQPKPGKPVQEFLRPGMSNGLACGDIERGIHGGRLISIKTAKLPGRGCLIITGGKQEDTKESARIAMSYVAAHAYKWGIKDVAFRRHDYHIHSPGEGGSAGVAIVMALISLLTGRAVRADVASTGTISLTGEVGSVGGIQEKIFGAYQAGVKTIILPKGNEHNLDNVPRVIKKGLEFILIETADEAIEKMFQ